jgi:hypothetical protein
LPLLHHMHQLMGYDPLTFSSGRVVLTWGEVDVPTLGKGQCAKGVGRRPLMYSDIGEVRPEG